MIDYTERNIKLWSTVGPRATLGLALLEFAKHDEKIMVVTGDVSSSAGLERFVKTYPGQYIDVGIAEQNMIGVAAGLSDNGYRVLTTTFAPFQTLRCLDQIKVNLSYSNISVVMVGLASGLVNGPLGNTHCCIEDVGALRSIPNICIVSPADGLSVVKAVSAALYQHTPTYIRLTGGANNPIVYNSDVEFEVGKAIEIQSGSDVTIIASGTAVHLSLEAAKLLQADGISVGVVDMHTIKPIDEQAIRRAVKVSGLVVTVEEHNVIGGLGSSVSEVIASLGSGATLVRIGVRDTFLKAGSYSYMLEQSELTPDAIARKVHSAL